MELKLSELQGKTQEELLLIAKGVQDLKKSLQKKKLDFYLKRAHPGQLDFHKIYRRIRYVFAGNRGGKSTAGMAELIWLCLGTHPFKRCRVPIKSVVILPDFENHAKNIFEPKLSEWTPNGSIKKIDRHQGGAIKKIHWTSGSTTDVLSHDQDMIVFEGSDYDVAWFDEPPPEKIWKAVWRGMTDRGGQMYMTGTPLSNPWVFKEYKRMEARANKDPLRWYIKFSSKANAKNLGQGDEALGLQRLEELASEYTEEERQARLDGDFLQLQGLIFKDFSRAVHMIDPFPIPHNWPIIESIDPHAQKDWAVSWIALCPNGSRILIKGIYLGGVIEDVANGILLGRSSLEIRDSMRPRLRQILIDNAASVPTWQRSNTDPTSRRLSVREELEKLIGPAVGAPRIECAPKNVAQKIALFKRWLKIRDRGGRTRPAFYAFSNVDNAEGFLDEIESYSWARYQSRSRDELKDQPVKKNDDILDTIMQVALTLGEAPEEPAEPVDMTGGFKGYAVR